MRSTIRFFRHTDHIGFLRCISSRRSLLEPANAFTKESRTVLRLRRQLCRSCFRCSANLQLLSIILPNLRCYVDSMRHLVMVRLHPFKPSKLINSYNEH